MLVLDETKVDKYQDFSSMSSMPDDIKDILENFDIEFMDDSSVNKHYPLVQNIEVSGVTEAINLAEDRLWETFKHHLVECLNQRSTKMGKVGKVTYQSPNKFCTVNKDLGLKTFHFVLLNSDNSCKVKSEINFNITKY